MDGLNEKIVSMIRFEILRCVKELLETKHLYQSVRIDTTKIQKMIDDADKSPEMKTEESRFRRLASASSGPGISLKSHMANALNRHRQNMRDSEQTILNNYWKFSTDTWIQRLITSKKKLSDCGTHFILPTISVPCSQCDAILPAHNSGFLGQEQEIQTVSWPIQKNGHMSICQTFVFPYHCQSCKKEPLIFLIHRTGTKLMLVGRNHFEKIQMPKTIPQRESKYFSDAISAYNTGNILAGLFLLRTVVEQYMRRILMVTEKKTGDELADGYASLLDDEFPKNRYPSLKVVYSELSVPLHAADNDADQFVKSREDIERHFELLKHFPLKDKNQALCHE